MSIPPPSRRAVIDIGTNSVKVLVADVANNNVIPVCEVSRQTRLGAGFYVTQRLQKSAIQLTAETVAEFNANAAQLGAGPVRVIATSAARDALNAGELIDAVREKSGLTMEILSGDTEAEWVFRGVTSHPGLSNAPVLILDVGGGSTEFIVGDRAVAQFRSSYSLGTVRMLEQLKPGDPPGLDALKKCQDDLREFLRKEVAPHLEPALRFCPHPPHLIGTGGSATIMARLQTRMAGFDRDKIEAVQIPLPWVDAHLVEQWQMTLQQRQQLVGMPPNRGDVILTGMAIYHTIMKEFNFSTLGVSTRGLRYWALLH